MKPYFTVPADFSSTVLPSYAEGSLKIPVREVYGSLKNLPIGGGRHSSVLPDCDEEMLTEYIKEASRLGIHFNYLVNASCMSALELTSEGQKQIGAMLEMLLQCGVRRLTISLPPLADFVFLHYPEFDVWLSVISGITSRTHLKRITENRPFCGIYLHEKLHRDLKHLAEVCDECRIRKMEVGMIVNTLCDADCPYRQFHYDLVSHTLPGQKEMPNLWYYGTVCKLRRLMDPKQVLRLPWVRPDDLPRYVELGVSRFKLAGRDLCKFGADFARTVADYTSAHFRGELSSLFLCYADVERRGVYNLGNTPRLSEYLEANFSGELNCLECSDCGRCAELAAEIAPRPEIREKYLSLYRKRRQRAMNLFE